MKSAKLASLLAVLVVGSLLFLGGCAEDLEQLNGDPEEPAPEAVVSTQLPG